MKKLFNEIEYFFINVDLFTFFMVTVMVLVIVGFFVMVFCFCTVETVTVVSVEEIGTKTSHPYSAMAVNSFLKKDYAMSAALASVKDKDTEYRVVLVTESGEEIVVETTEHFEVGYSFRKVIEHW